MTRYPIAPLEQHLAGDDGAPTVAQVALALGVTRRTVARWRNRGLDELQADRAAIALGVHPAELWGNAWWTGALHTGEAIA